MAITNKNAKIDFEINVTPFPMQALTDRGDHFYFTSPADLFSELDGYSPDIRPNGILTGGAITAGSVNNEVDIATLSCYLSGVLQAVIANTLSITRPLSAVAKINSITVNSSGTLVMVAGTDGATTTFSEVRGAAGGPPFIAVGSIEVGQVRVASQTAGLILASEIFQVEGTHRELSGFPTFSTINEDAAVQFSGVLPLIHTGSITKGIYGSFAEPIFIEQEFANDFVPAEVTNSLSSTDTYSGPTAATSKAIGQGTFTAFLADGISDPILGKAGQTVWFRFYQDRFKSAHILTQGLLGVARTFPVANRPTASVTISASDPSINKSF